MINTYSREQVLDSLLRQNFSPQQAQAMYEAMGDERKSGNQIKSGYTAVGARGASLPSGDDGQQDSTFLPNLAEGAGTTAAMGYLSSKIPKLANKAYFGQNALRSMGRLAGTGLAGNIATMGTVLATDNNSYDRMTTPQIAADIAGSIGGYNLGGSLGQAAGERFAKSATAAGIQKAVESAAMHAGEAGLKGLAGRGAVTALAGRGAAALAGRAGGAALGSVLSPIGSIALGALGGWLLPKLLPNGSEAVKDDPLANQSNVVSDVIKRNRINNWKTPLGGDTTDQMYGEQP